MAPPQLSEEQLLQLKAFIALCEKEPELLHTEQLKFFKDFLVKEFQANIPDPPQREPEEEKPKSPEPQEQPPQSPMDEGQEEHPTEEVESDLELDTLDGVVEPDADEPVPFGDDTMNVTEEMEQESREKKDQAMQAMSEGNLEATINLLSEAILKNPQSGAFYAKRASVFLKMRKPNSAIRDCDKALSLNPDQALAFKCRGRAYRLLGDWEKSACDLAMACKIDYDEEANEWLKEVMPNAKKIQDHRRKYERQNQERELRRRAREREQRRKQEAGDSGGFTFPGGVPFMPGGIEKILQDPEVLEAFQDPEVAAAFQEISADPSSIPRYQSNPKISRIIDMMTRKVAGEFK